MANDLSKVTPKLLAQGLLALRSACVMPRLVNRQYEQEAGKKGSTIEVPIPSAIAAQAVAPNNTPPSTADMAPTSVNIELDQWYEAPFYMTDKDMMTAMEGTIPMQASEAINSLARQVNGHILSLGSQLFAFHGTPGTTPFASDTSDATNTRKLLNKNLAPLSDRRFVIDPDAEGNALNLRAFQDTSWTGDKAGITEGDLNRKLGFNWFMDQQIPSWTAGTLTGTIVVGGAGAALGVKVVPLATDAAEAIALKAGDIVTFTGDTQTYVVTADLTVGASSSGNLNIYPGVKTAKAAGVAIAVKASHVMNLAFHRDCFAFASRPLADNTQGLGNLITSAVDPVSGLALRLEVSREHKRTRWSYDILWGAQCVRRELGARLAG